MTNDTEARAAYVKGLRMLAAALEAHPEVPLPADGTRLPMGWNLWGEDAREQMAATARAIPCTWAKKVRDGYDGSPAYFDLDGTLAGLRLKITAFRDAVCTRRVTGTREVAETVPDPAALAAVPRVEVTRTEDIVTWDCGSLLSPETAAAAPKSFGISEREGGG